MAKIWHAKNPSQQNFPADYELVAEVETDNLETAFELTNTIHCAWWENQGVTPFKRTRSTSVGDVVEINGRCYLYAMAGWTEITAVPKGEQDDRVEGDMSC